MKKQSSRFWAVKGMMSVFVGLSLFQASDSFAKDFKIDSVHSNVRFTVRHLVSKLSGEFKEVNGNISFDPKRPEKSVIRATVPVNSISTKDKKRDEHLRSPDFFSEKEFPTLSFASTHVEKDGDKQYKMMGELTLHGVKKPVLFNVEYLGESKDFQGNTVVGFSAVATINRKDFGMTWNKTLDSGGVVISDEVTINVDVEASAK